MLHKISIKGLPYGKAISYEETCTTKSCAEEKHFIPDLWSHAAHCSHFQ